VSLKDDEIEDLMKAYNTLSLFPDVPPLFTHLKEAPYIHPVVFSNGTSSMINASLSESPDLSPHKDLFKQVVVVEKVKKFKPHPDVYSHLCKEVGKDGKEGEVWLVSGNPFDVVGANVFGMKTCWVDRSGTGWVDRLVQGDKGRPTVIVKGLNEVVGKVEGFLKSA
jgi:2-haloacid dehalogenase